ncbi:MAG: type II toxin-antitoxin system HicA family toxin [Bacteroidota bacterium]
MGTQDKLIIRFLSKPKDFTYNELTRLLGYYGYIVVQGSGSRVVFLNRQNGRKIKLHKPHPGNILKRYQMELIEKMLKELGLL